MILRGELLWGLLGAAWVLAAGLVGLLNASELALAAAHRGAVRRLGAQGAGAALALDELLAASPRFLVAHMLGKTLLCLGAGLAVMWCLEALALDANARGILLASTALLLVGAQSAGRIWVGRNATRCALRLIRAAQIVDGVFWPLSWLFLLWARRTQGERAAGAEERTFLSLEGLRLLIDVNDAEAEIKEAEKRMIANMVELRDTPVREVMVPRIDMASVPVDMPVSEALDVILETGHSRIPVYADSSDAIEGVLYAKDILELYRDDALNRPLADIMREPYFVPASKKVDTMLREFQANRIHIAIVVDEFGGTSGLVTIEDLMEEIFGEIQDEYDHEPPELTRINENLYEFDARFDLDDAARILNVDLPVDTADTIGGFVFSQLGRVPVQHDHVPFKDWLFKVSRIESSRVKKVQAQRYSPASGA